MNLIEVILPGAASGRPVEGGVISASHSEEFLMMVGADCQASGSCTLNDFLLRADPVCTEADGGAEADADVPGDFVSSVILASGRPAVDEGDEFLLRAHALVVV